MHHEVTVPRYITGRVFKFTSAGGLKVCNKSRDGLKIRLQEIGMIRYSTETAAPLLVINSNYTFDASAHPLFFVCECSDIGADFRRSRARCGFDRVCFMPA